MRLNQAVALSMAGQVEQAASALEALAVLKDMQSYVGFHLARAEVFERLGLSRDVKDALGLALESTRNAAEAEFIRSKIGYLN